MLIQAIATLARSGQPVTATIVGDGPDRDAFEAAVTAHHLDDAVKFVGAMPARAAFALGRLLVVPSRAESLPYIVLEAAAAGLPMIATRVGGLPEIFGADAPELVRAGRCRGARPRHRRCPAAIPPPQQETALRFKSACAHAFSTDAMTDAVLAAYREALTLRQHRDKVNEAAGSLLSP